MPCFKSAIHRVVSAFKLNTKADLLKINLFLDSNEYFDCELTDFYLTDLAKYAKKNIELPSKTEIDNVVDTDIEIINKKTVSHPIIVKEKAMEDVNPEDLVDASNDDEKEEEEIKEVKEGFEQISIFDDLDD